MKRTCRRPNIATSPPSQHRHLPQLPSPTCSNGCYTEGTYEYWNDFDDGAVVPAGGYYVICHGSADDEIQGYCDETFSYLSNGDDVIALVYGTEDSFTVVDTVGDAWSSTDPGSSWTVCGDSSATQDNTLIRTSCTPNGGSWAVDEDADTCSWSIYDQDEMWDSLNTFTCSCDACTTAPSPTGTSSPIPSPTAEPTGSPSAAPTLAPTRTFAPSPPTDVGCGGELLFTMVAEGSSNNKFIEIHNPTCNDIDLADYG